MALARVPEKQLDTKVLIEGEDISALGSGAATIGEVPLADGVGGLALGDLSGAASGVATIGFVLTADGAGGVSFASPAAGSFFAKTVGASGDFADMGAAFDAVSVSAAPFGILLILDKVSWGIPTLTLNKPIIIQGIADDSEINIDGNTILSVDLVSGAGDGLALLELRTLLLTRNAPDMGGFDFAHDTIIRMKNMTITDSTTQVVAQGIFDGSGVDLTTVLEGVTITSAGVEAKLFSRWTSVNAHLDGIKGLTGADFFNNVTSAELLLDNYTILNDVGMTSSTMNIRYATNSLMLKDTGGGTITDVDGVAVYNKAFDAIAGLDWGDVLPFFVGTELHIDEGTFSTATPNLTVPSTAKITGRGPDSTILVSTASVAGQAPAGTHILRLNGAGSNISDIQIQSNPTATNGAIDILDLLGADSFAHNVRLDYQDTTTAISQMMRIVGDRIRVIDCDFLMSGLVPDDCIQVSKDLVIIDNCRFRYTGAAATTETLTIINAQTVPMPAGGTLTVTDCHVNLGNHAGLSNIFIHGPSVSTFMTIKNNDLVGNFQSFLLDGTITRSVIQGNNIDMSLGGAGSTAAINLTGILTSVIISENTVLNCSSRGIDINVGTSLASLIVIANNVLSGNTSDEGIRLNGNVQKSVIRGNIIDNFATGLLTATSVGNTPDNNQYIGNHLEGNTTPITIDSLDTSEISHNVEV